MTWRWPWQRRNGHDSKQVAANAEESLRRTQNQRPAVERMAQRVTPEDLVERIADAFGRPAK